MAKKKVKKKSYLCTCKPNVKQRLSGRLMGCRQGRRHTIVSLDDQK